MDACYALTFLLVFSQLAATWSPASVTLDDNALVFSPSMSATLDYSRSLSDQKVDTSSLAGTTDTARLMFASANTLGLKPFGSTPAAPSIGDSSHDLQLAQEHRLNI